MKLLLAAILFVTATFSAHRSNAKEVCFDMIPYGAINDKTCAPVPTKLNILDCLTGEVKKSVDARARLTCNTSPKTIKYWHEDAMFVGELTKTRVDGKDVYKVSKTYALSYDNKQYPQVISKPVAVVPIVAGAAVGAGVGAAVGAASATGHGGTAASTTAAGPAATAPAANKVDAHGATALPAPQNLKAEVPAAPALPETAKPAAPVVGAANVEAAPLSKQTLQFMNGIKFNGLVDSYYSYNFNKPPVLGAPSSSGYVGAPRPAGGTATQTNQFYNIHHDQFILNFARLSVSRDAEPVGFKMDLGFGPQADLVSGNGTDQSNRNLLQGYINYKSPCGLVFQVGKFYTWLGLEVVDSDQNWNYSHTWGFAYALPVWHTGTMLGYEYGKVGSLYLYAVNGWNSNYDTNASKTFGAQLKVTPVEGLTFIGNAISGNEAPAATANSDDNRMVLEGIGIWETPVTGLKVAVDYMGTSEKLAGFSKYMSSAAAYANYSFAEDFSISPRFETFNDQLIGIGPSLATTDGQTITAVTTTLEWRAAKGLRFLGEYRIDNSSVGYFTDSTGATTQTQSVTTLAAILTL